MKIRGSRFNRVATLLLAVAIMLNLGPIGALPFSYAVDDSTVEKTTDTDVVTDSQNNVNSSDDTSVSDDSEEMDDSQDDPTPSEETKQPAEPKKAVKNSPLRAASDGDPEGDATTPTYGIKWISGTDEAEINGSALTQEPSNNSSDTGVTAELEFHNDGKRTLEEGAVEIRLPRHLFKVGGNGRENTGEGTGSYKVGVTNDKSATTASSPFYYYIDEDTDEIVITNGKAITDQHNFTCQVAYTYKPTDIQNGTTFQLNTTAKVNGSDADLVNSGTRDLTAKVITSAYLDTVDKKVVDRFDNWASEWGTKPSNVNNHFFAVFAVEASANDDLTQPFKLSINDTPGNGGIVVAYADGSAEYGSPRYTAGNDWHTITKTNLSKLDFPANGAGYTSPGGASGSYRYYVVVAYPNSLKNSGTDITNKAEVSLKPIDGGIQKDNDTASFKYTTSQFKYSGDLYGITKSLDNRYSSQYQMTLLENGQSVLAGVFRNQGTAKGWSNTKDDNGNYDKREWTAEVIDDQIYLEGELLQPGDYCFSDVFAYNEETVLSYNAARGDYEEVKLSTGQSTAPDIWYRTSAAGQWIKANSTLDSNGNRIARATVPEDAIAVKATVTGKGYQYKPLLGCAVYLNPTDHVKEILQDVVDDGSNTATMTNVSAIRAVDDKGIVQNKTDSNSIGGSLAEQVKEHDQAGKYGDNNGDLPEGKYLQHSSVKVILRDLDIKHNIKKAAMSPQQDAANKRETVDYYFSHKLDDSIYTEDPENLKSVLEDSNLIYEVCK